MSDYIPQSFIDQHTGKDCYTVLHGAVLDLVMSVRTIKQVSLLLYLKKAIVTLYLDTQESPSTIENLRMLVESDDPLPGLNLTTLSNILVNINIRLAQLDMEIAESKDMDDSNINIFSFVNKKPIGAIRLSTKYSQNDIQLVKDVIDRIFSPEYVNKNNVTDDSSVVHPQINYSVPYMTMVKYLRDGPETTDEDAPLIARFGIEESDLFLRDLECYGWLERNHNNYTLATRGLVELKKYLIDKYGKSPEGTVSICFGCGDILTRGLSCLDASCHVRFHRHCRELVQNTRDDDSCPNKDCTETLQTYYTF